MPSPSTIAFQIKEHPKKSNRLLIRQIITCFIVILMGFPLVFLFDFVLNTYYGFVFSVVLLLIPILIWWNYKHEYNQLLQNWQVVVEEDAIAISYLTTVSIQYQEIAELSWNRS